MLPLLAGLIAAIASYFGAYAREANDAVAFANSRQAEIETMLDYLPKEEALQAMCIVAPEISQYSSFYDAAEVYALAALYVNGGTADFSIGHFQMKPSFAETVENTVERTPALRRKYDMLKISGDGRQQRGERVSRLKSLKWQILYLAAFYDIVAAKTSKICFKDPTERMKYYATLYNGGINLTAEQVAARQRVRQFPRGRATKFNYAAIAAEYFANENYCGYLRK